MKVVAAYIRLPNVRPRPRHPRSALSTPPPLDRLGKDLPDPLRPVGGMVDVLRHALRRLPQLDTGFAERLGDRHDVEPVRCPRYRDAEHGALAPPESDAAGDARRGRADRQRWLGPTLDRVQDISAEVLQIAP